MTLDQLYASLTRIAGPERDDDVQVAVIRTWQADPENPIAYAKQVTDIQLSPEAAEMIKNFYIDMRNQYAGADKNAVAITLRQYEALLRLAEASAKIRLDTVVRKEDAERHHEGVGAIGPEAGGQLVPGAFRAGCGGSYRPTAAGCP